MFILVTFCWRNGWGSMESQKLRQDFGNVRLNQFVSIYLLWRKTEQWLGPKSLLIFKWLRRFHVVDKWGRLTSKNFCDSWASMTPLGFMSNDKSLFPDLSDFVWPPRIPPFYSKSKKSVKTYLLTNCVAINVTSKKNLTKSDRVLRRHKIKNEK